MFCDFSHLSKSAVPTCYRSTLNYSLTTAPLLPEYALWPCLPPPALPSELSTLKAIDGWACFDWFWIHLNIAVGEFSADVTEFTCWGRGGCWQKGKEFQWEKELEGRERWWGETSRPSWWERIRGRAENGKCSTDGDGREAHVWLIPQAVLSSGFSSCLENDLVKSVLQGKVTVVHVMGWKRWWTWSYVSDHGNLGVWLFQEIMSSPPFPLCSQLRQMEEQD